MDCAGCIYILGNIQHSHAHTCTCTHTYTIKEKDCEFERMQELGYMGRFEEKKGKEKMI